MIFIIDLLRELRKGKPEASRVASNLRRFGGTYVVVIVASVSLNPDQLFAADRAVIFAIISVLAIGALAWLVGTGIRQGRGWTKLAAWVWVLNSFGYICYCTVHSFIDFIPMWLVSLSTGAPFFIMIASLFALTPVAVTLFAGCIAFLAINYLMRMEVSSPCNVNELQYIDAPIPIGRRALVVLIVVIIMRVGAFVTTAIPLGWILIPVLVVGCIWAMVRHNHKATRFEREYTLLKVVRNELRLSRVLIYKEGLEVRWWWHATFVPYIHMRCPSQRTLGKPILRIEVDAPGLPRHIDLSPSPFESSWATIGNTWSQATGFKNTPKEPQPFKDRSWHFFNGFIVFALASLWSGYLGDAGTSILWTLFGSLAVLVLTIVCSKSVPMLRRTSIRYLVVYAATIIILVSYTLAHTHYLLHGAVFNNHKSVAKFALWLGADPNRSDRYGARPIQLAVMLGELAMVDLLIDNGADPYQVNREWDGHPWTLMDYACRSKNEEVIARVQHLGIEHADPENECNQPH